MATWVLEPIASSYSPNKQTRSFTCRRQPGHLRWGRSAAMVGRRRYHVLSQAISSGCPAQPAARTESSAPYEQTPRHAAGAKRILMNVNRPRHLQKSISAVRRHIKVDLMAGQQAQSRSSFQPPKGLTVAQLGPPSFPVPGTRASRTACDLIIAIVMPLRGIFNLRLQRESCWPAYVPMSR
jgi:hypothetical protein